MKKLRNHRRKKGWCVQCGFVLSDQERIESRKNCGECRKKARVTGRSYRLRQREKLSTINPESAPKLAKVKLPPGPYFTRATQPSMGHIRWGRLKSFLLKKLNQAKGIDPHLHRMLATMSAIERGLDPDEVVR